VAAFVIPSQVRDYLNEQALTGSWSDAQIGSNIRAASANLQRWTGRQFEAQTAASKTFTTNGQAVIHIPDVRSVSSVSSHGSPLTVDEGYWLVPDRYDQSVAIGMTFRVVNSGQDPLWYLHDSQWWDKGLDLYHRSWASSPNDLVVVGDWGWDPLPEPLLHATKVLAGYYTLRPASILADVRITEGGAILSYRSLPQEVQDFVTDWRIGPMAVMI